MCRFLVCCRFIMRWTESTELLVCIRRIGKRAYVYETHCVYFWVWIFFCVHWVQKDVSVKPLNLMLTNIETLYGNRHHHDLTLGECKITRIYFECNPTLPVLRCADILIYVCSWVLYYCTKWHIHTRTHMWAVLRVDCMLSFAFNFRQQSREYSFLLSLIHHSRGWISITTSTPKFWSQS